ncbi:LodA/GoxA family CTQ-dependent oxidase [Mucilaginibacter jinjuensis]|uniref:LodA/GoxA family CTQ-dependent oxidase n=1 Tax=Mucilaginibacter jinjuensis TaxID=1176721 RepID=A0ABY7TC43_9SPHI|nr:LodA/GoxA family CTQ-dependent oxidase [Mucilaginibacter jinjuensis]WCT13783.1 LodA/GoxA family CTQ-dependent oxidase [Mucilaginibacter jinjuensis]
MSVNKVFRIHPTINFARIGTSKEYYLSPETSAGLPIDGSATTGGLPIKPGTENTVIDATDLRDEDGYLKRQAARFRLYYYELDGPDAYPCPAKPTEVIKGTVLADGRKVKDIIWTVHLANKKAASYNVVPLVGVDAYKDGLPQLRNPQVYGTTGTVNDPIRLKNLVIDPGPRAVSAVANNKLKFNAKTPASYSSNGQIEEITTYPATFPSGELHYPSGKLDSLGEILTDKEGRLLVLAAHGNTAAGIDEYGDPVPCTGDLNNASWYDDAADGPVSATIVFEDGTFQEAFNAWVVCCDPSYAPQIRNVVSIWDDVYDAWVRGLNLQPQLFAEGNFNPAFLPAFESMVRPVFRAALLQRWTVNLPRMAIKAHEAVDAITAADNPDKTIMAGLNFIRNPNLTGTAQSEVNTGVPLMPLSVGDAGTSFLTVTKTQYFFLEQWSKHNFTDGEGQQLGKGEYLDMASLSNCLGGRYVPGIEMSYVIRSTDIYQQDWQTSGAGPFRLKAIPLNYAKANQAPFLTAGWFPLQEDLNGLEPGDMTKFMAIPWQTDYNSCSIHQPSINTNGVNKTNGNGTTLYWSWPAQRPDAVFVAEQVISNVLPKQQWAIRGKGTYSLDPKSASTFQKANQSVKDWDKLGVIVQGTIIGPDYDPDYYLEVQNQFDETVIPDNPALEWPFNTTPPANTPI